MEKLDHPFFDENKRESHWLNLRPFSDGSTKSLENCCKGAAKDSPRPRGLLRGSKDGMEGSLRGGSGGGGAGKHTVFHRYSDWETAGCSWGNLEQPQSHFSSQSDWDWESGKVF